MARSSELRFLGWAGYERRQLLEPFCTRYGSRVCAETITSDAEAAERILNGGWRHWDVVNLNNPFARGPLDDAGLVHSLSEEGFGWGDRSLLPRLGELYEWSRSRDGSRRLGICQRFGPFNLVVDARRISVGAAEDQGFELARDPLLRRRFGILAYDDFNVLHGCIAAGVNPFVRVGESELERFSRTVEDWHRAARMVTKDHEALNRALCKGEIEFYLGGGIYTIAPVRLEGHGRYHAVTPRRGPIDGKGGIVFMEVTSVIRGSPVAALAEEFLRYLLTPEAAVFIGTASGMCNPVAQMGDPRVMSGYSPAHLDAIQWETLDEDVSRCVPYALIPDYSRLLGCVEQVRRSSPGQEKWGTFLYP